MSIIVYNGEWRDDREGKNLVERFMEKARMGRNLGTNILLEEEEEEEEEEETSQEHKQQ
jgi:hypothetical protein